MLFFAEFTEFYYSNCKEILDSNPQAQNGVYTILPSGSSDQIELFCDMERGGYLVRIFFNITKFILCIDLLK